MVVGGDVVIVCRGLCSDHVHGVGRSVDARKHKVALWVAEQARRASAPAADTYLLRFAVCVSASSGPCIMPLYSYGFVGLE